MKRYAVLRLYDIGSPECDIEHVALTEREAREWVEAQMHGPPDYRRRKWLPYDTEQGEEPYEWADDPRDPNERVHIEKLEVPDGPPEMRMAPAVPHEHSFALAAGQWETEVNGGEEMDELDDFVEDDIY